MTNKTLNPWEEQRIWGNFAKRRNTQEHGSTKTLSSSSKTSSLRKKAESWKFQNRNWKNIWKRSTMTQKAWTDSYSTWYPTYSTSWIQPGGWPSKLEGSRVQYGTQDQHQPLGRMEYSVVYQGPNQTNQDSIKTWLKHEEPNSTRQQQEVINQTPSSSPSEYTLQY